MQFWGGVMVNKVLTDIHRYWFGLLTAPSDAARSKAEMWFTRSDLTDAFIRDNFGKYLNAARTTEWDLPNLSREEKVGLIVLLDQFPRNIFRETGDAFASDAKARAIARELVRDGEWTKFYSVEQAFVLLPFEHSEDIADQDFSVLLFAERIFITPPNLVESARMHLDFATKHRDIIRKFGRFPHRNVMLGRESTPEEVEFLKGGRGY
jgi:uncharacterized protein (DUF924 family)